MEIEIYKDYYKERIMFDKDKIEIKPGFTVLVGCNGAGKTTLLYQIKDYLEKNKIRYVRYNNLTNGGNSSLENLIFHGRTEEAAVMATSSEGERIHQNIAFLASSIGKNTRNIKNGEDFVVLLDAIDSGLSIDNIIDIKDFFKNIFIPDYEKTSKGLAYVIAVANEYEMANGERCFAVQECEEIEFKDYEDYKSFILKSREKKTKSIDDYYKAKKENDNPLKIKRNKKKGET